MLSFCAIAMEFGAFFIAHSTKYVIEITPKLTILAFSKLGN